MGTGQYDYQIYQTLLRIEEVLDSFTTFFESIVNNWFPITVAGITALALISLIKWVVKL